MTVRTVVRLIPKRNSIEVVLRNNIIELIENYLFDSRAYIQVISDQLNIQRYVHTTSALVLLGYVLSELRGKKVLLQLKEPNHSLKLEIELKDVELIRDGIVLRITDNFKRTVLKSTLIQFSY